MSKRCLCIYLVPELHALVSQVWEVLAGDVSASARLNLQLAILKHHLTLTQNQRRTPTALQTLKNVVFRSLHEGGLRGRRQRM